MEGLLLRKTAVHNEKISTPVLEETILDSTIDMEKNTTSPGRRN